MQALVWALDRELHEQIKTNAPPASGMLDRTFFSESILSANALLGGDGTTFRNAAFNVITCAKLFAVQSVLGLGYNVLMSDTDVFFFSDPWPWVGHLHRHQKPGDACDLEYSPNAGPFVFDQCVKNVTCRPNTEMNTGYYFARSTPATRLLFDASLASCQKRPTIDDQSNFWFNANPACGWSRTVPVINPPPSLGAILSASPLSSSAGGSAPSAPPLLCPLPLLTHSTGQFFKSQSGPPGSWDKARRSSSAGGGYAEETVVVGHFNMGHSYAQKEALVAKAMSATGVAGRC